MSDYRLAIRELVEMRLKVLGIRRVEVVRRCGFKNLNKGIRRLEAVVGGGDLDSSSARMILRALPIALEVEEGVVDVAVRQTADSIDQSNRMAAAEQDAAWRASFKPHAYLVGTETRPSSITMFGFSGGPERWLKCYWNATSAIVCPVSAFSDHAAYPKRLKYQAKRIFRAIPPTGMPPQNDCDDERYREPSRPRAPTDPDCHDLTRHRPGVRMPSPYGGPDSSKDKSHARAVRPLR